MPPSGRRTVQLGARGDGGAQIKGSEGPRDQGDELRGPKEQEQEQEHSAQDAGQQAGDQGTLAADGLLQVGLGQVPGGPAADGAADRGRQFLAVQVEPVDDAVLGPGKVCSTCRAA